MFFLHTEVLYISNDIAADINVRTTKGLSPCFKRNKPVNIQSIGRIIKKLAHILIILFFIIRLLIIIRTCLQ